MEGHAEADEATPAAVHRRPAGRSKTDASRARPAPLNKVVSAQMQRMPRASTRPEMALRRELHRLGVRFRVNYRGLPGKPDVVLTRAKVAVFVDGCFWHRCVEHGSLPRNNEQWWAEKLERNVRRDREKDEALARLGWHVVHVWEHEDPVRAAAAVRDLWLERRAGRPVAATPADPPVGPESEQ